MNRRFAECLRIALPTILLAACVAFGGSSVPATVSEAGPGAPAALEHGLVSNEQQMVRPSDADVVAQSSTTERTVGYLAMIAAVVVLVGLAIGLYSLAKILGG